MTIKFSGPNSNVIRRKYMEITLTKPVLAAEIKRT